MPDLRKSPGPEGRVSTSNRRLPSKSRHDAVDLREASKRAFAEQGIPFYFR
jgi:hypothetical protein